MTAGAFLAQLLPQTDSRLWPLEEPSHLAQIAQVAQLPWIGCSIILDRSQNKGYLGQLGKLSRESKSRTWAFDYLLSLPSQLRYPLLWLLSNIIEQPIQGSYSIAKQSKLAGWALCKARDGYLGQLCKKGSSHSCLDSLPGQAPFYYIARAGYLGKLGKLSKLGQLGQL